MIIDLYIKIATKGCRKLDNFKKLGYDITGDFIELKVSDLNTGSRQLVNIECDFCKKIVSATYKEYSRNISIGNKYACSKHCGSLKAKDTNLIKYGVEHPMMLGETQDKVKNTNLDRYGVEFLQQSNIIRDKSKVTNLIRYGFDSYSKTDEFLIKFKSTNLDKYGVEFPSQSEIIRNKSKETWISNLGVDNPSKSIDVRNKVKNTNLDKYGVEIPIKLDEFKHKTIKTNLDRYGVDNPMKSDFLRKDKYSITSDSSLLKYINNSKSLMRCELGHEFEIHIDNYYMRISSNLPLCTICYPIGNTRSIKELELYKFISSIYNGVIMQSYRDGLEIDIYLPDLKLGFEFNGLYWHSEEYKERNYHSKKTQYFNEIGIRIIHIWEDDWVFNNDIIKSQIRNWISTTSFKIFARVCEIKEVGLTECREFLNKNHIQGYTNSTKKIGLYLSNELVSLMTFDNLEGRKRMLDNEWNLNRFCNKLDTNVVGGASRLLNYFIKNNNPTRIISYADKDWSQGDLYYKLGFSNINESKEDYKYIVNGKRVHKSRYSKSKLKTNLSESLEMKNKGLYKIWDCGKIKFEMLF